MGHWMVKTQRDGKPPFFGGGAENGLSAAKS